MTDKSSRARHATLIQRRLVLELLQRFGPLAVTEIPCTWPLTRQHVAAIVRDLAEAGAVSFAWDPRVPGRRMARLTAEGVRLLAALDDDAMAALADPAPYPKVAPARDAHLAAAG